MNELHISLMVWTYLAYLAIAVAITVWVGRNLKRHGIVVATNGDETDRDIVDAFSRLLVVGFYLVSFGAVNIALKEGTSVASVQSALELVSSKIGWILLILGVMNMVLTLVFSEVRKQRRREHRDRELSLESFDGNRRQPVA
jgi:hypothetical protein